MDRFTKFQNQEETCFLCLSKADNLCEFCSIPFCCGEHYKAHRNQEGTYCYPFRILQRPEVGRYVVATRDLKPLEIVLEDFPGIFGPNHNTGPACMECLLPVDPGGPYLCPKCSLPLCGSKCQDGPNHRPECQVFSQTLPSGFQFRVDCSREPMPGQTKVISPEYACIAPLRGLLLKQNQPEMWSRMSLLMDSEVDPDMEEDYKQMIQVNVVNFLKNVCQLKFTEKEIQKVCGILRTNALMVEDPYMKIAGVAGRVVYPTFSYLSHSCISNGRISMEPLTHKMTVRAQTEIKKGEEVTFQYLSFLHSHFQRKLEIRSAWMFDCNCQRCQDPTELGSYMSAVKCSKCDSGFALPSNPMDLKSNWICNQSDCEEEMAHTKVIDIVRDCESILKDAHDFDVGQNESVLDLLLTKLHPNHSLIMVVKKRLADLFGKLSGFLYNQLSRQTLERKIQFYKDYLTMLDKVDPGVTKWRGEVLFELHTPLVIRANNLLHKKEISIEEFQDSLRNAAKILEESIHCLESEHNGSKAAGQSNIARKALIGLKEMISFSNFM